MAILVHFALQPFQVFLGAASTKFVHPSLATASQSLLQPGRSRVSRLPHPASSRHGTSLPVSRRETAVELTGIIRCQGTPWRLQLVLGKLGEMRHITGIIPGLLETQHPHHSKVCQNQQAVEHVLLVLLIYATTHTLPAGKQNLIPGHPRLPCALSKPEQKVGSKHPGNRAPWRQPWRRAA